MPTDSSRDLGGGGGPRYPSEETLALVRDALSRYVSAEVDDEQVCEALVVLAREAESRGLNAEHMLLAFKRIWAELPEIRALRHGGKERSLREHLVTLCLDSYFAR